MKKIVVRGNKSLSGCVSVGGSKNAALPIIFASIITHGVSVIENVPNIGDVSVAIELIESLGARVRREGSTLYIDTRELSYREPDASLMSKIRASTYLLGAMLSRFGVFRATEFGGCNFSLRPIDMHINAAISFGAAYRDGVLTADRLVGCEINFMKVSVGATVNAIIMSSAAEGTTVIFRAAREPHITSLIEYLNSAGARISQTDDKVVVRGGKLSGGRVRIIGDMIEAGTYLSAALATRGDITVSDFSPAEISPFLMMLTELGAVLSVSERSVTLSSGRNSRFISVRANPYPDFPTDLQPIAAPLMASRLGGVIIDNVWQSRFGYLDTLSAFGVKSYHKDGFALINKSKIKRASVSAPDLRGGAASVICALIAEGESVISDAEIIYRGYDSLEEKLRNLGANIYLN